MTVSGFIKLCCFSRGLGQQSYISFFVQICRKAVTLWTSHLHQILFIVPCSQAEGGLFWTVSFHHLYRTTGYSQSAWLRQRNIFRPGDREGPGFCVLISFQSSVTWFLLRKPRVSLGRLSRWTSLVKANSRPEEFVDAAWRFLIYIYTQMVQFFIWQATVRNNMVDQKSLSRRNMPNVQYLLAAELHCHSWAYCCGQSRIGLEGMHLLFS